MKADLRILSLASIEREHDLERAHNLGKTSVKISFQLGEGRVNYWLHRQAAMLSLAREKRLEAEGWKEKAASAMAESKQLTNEAAKMAAFLSADVVEGVWELTGDLFGSVGIDRQWIEDSFGPVPESLMPLEPYRRDAIMSKLAKNGQGELFANPALETVDGDQGEGQALEGAKGGQGDGDLEPPDSDHGNDDLDAPDASENDQGEGQALEGSDAIPFGDADPDRAHTRASDPDSITSAVLAPRRRRVLASKGGSVQEVSGGDGQDSVYVG